ncbi:MAG: DUF4236 domain-containing protein [Holophagales bacterium]|nr:DUF4236 domain-containing protein [Holophagales bacterium]
MGFYIRKSISVGPFRFNLSKSGIGTSIGVRGFRVGGGPRGNYVHMGRYGLYYRQTLSAPSQRRRLSPAGGEAPTVQGLGPFMPVESATADNLSSADSEALLQEIRQKRSRFPFFPLVLGVSIVGLASLASQKELSAWVVPALTLAAVACVAAWMQDRVRKTVVLFYDFDPDAERRFQSLHDAVHELKDVSALWIIESAADVHDWKRNAGAKRTIKRLTTRPKLSRPPNIKTNIDIPTLKSHAQSLHFMPDRLLVFEGSTCGAVAYDELSVEISPTRFIEDGSVPADAEIVDHTWRYPNRSGGPDARFNGNRKIPIALYDLVVLSSPSGLRAEYHVSRRGAAMKLQEAVRIAGIGHSEPTQSVIINGQEGGGPDALPAVTFTDTASALLDQLSAALTVLNQRFNPPMPEEPSWKEAVRSASDQILAAASANERLQPTTSLEPVHQLLRQSFAEYAHVASRLIVALDHFDTNALTDLGEHYARAEKYMQEATAKLSAPARRDHGRGEGQPRSFEVEIANVDGVAGADPLEDVAIRLIRQSGKASASLLQRHLEIGYTRAARILDLLEMKGFIGPADGVSPRVIMKSRDTTPRTTTLV